MAGVPGGSDFRADTGRVLRKNSFRRPVLAVSSLRKLLPLHPELQANPVLGAVSILRAIGGKVDVEDRIDRNPTAQAVDPGSTLRQFETAIGSDQTAPGQCRQTPTDIGDEPGFRCIAIR